MLIVPVQAVANQTFGVLLGEQSCQVALNTREDGNLYFSLNVNNVTVIVNNVICEDRNRLVRYAYLGFIGDFWFLDTQAAVDLDGNIMGQDPIYTGLGTRYLLEYLEASDLSA